MNGTALWHRLHPLGRDDLGARLAAHQLDQGFRRGPLAGRRPHRRGIDRVVLDLGRQRPGEHNTLHGKDFADLLDRDVGLAADNPIGGTAALDQHGLGPHLRTDAEPIDQLREIDSAGTARRRIDIGHRPRLQQRLLERLDGADIGPLGAIFHSDPDTNPGEPDRIAGDLARLLQFRDHRGRSHQQIEALPRLDPLEQPANGIAVELDNGPVLLEPRNDTQQNLLESAGAQHLQRFSGRKAGPARGDRTRDRSYSGISPFQHRPMIPPVPNDQLISSMQYTSSQKKARRSGPFGRNIQKTEIGSWIRPWIRS